VDVAGRRLVTCGSVFQGTCQLRHIEDIDDAVEADSRGNTDYFVAANDPEMSTVAFVAPGPGRVDALYVAATYTGGAATAVRQAVPAVSVRAIDGTATSFRLDFLDQELISYRYSSCSSCSSCWSNVFKRIKLCRFKLDWDEICQDCSSSKYASIEGQIFHLMSHFQYDSHDISHG